MDTRARNHLRRAYWDAVERLRAAIDDEPAATDSVAQARILAAIDALRGMGGSAWILFDEKDGWRDAGHRRFAVVRQARNSPIYGPQLLRAVNQRVTGRKHAA